MINWKQITLILYDNVSYTIIHFPPKIIVKHFFSGQPQVFETSLWSVPPRGHEQQTQESKVCVSGIYRQIWQRIYQVGF